MGEARGTQRGPKGTQGNPSGTQRGSRGSLFLVALKVAVGQQGNPQTQSRRSRGRRASFPPTAAQAPAKKMRKKRGRKSKVLEGDEGAGGEGDEDAEAGMGDGEGQSIPFLEDKSEEGFEEKKGEEELGEARQHRTPPDTPDITRHTRHHQTAPESTRHYQTPQDNTRHHKRHHQTPPETTRQH